MASGEHQTSPELRGISQARTSTAAAALIAVIAGGCREEDEETATPPDEESAAAPQAAGGPEHEPEREPPPLPEAAPLPEDPGGHDGDVQWAVRFGGPDKDAARGIATLGDGAVVAGYVSETVTFGDTTHEAVDVDAYVTRLDADGQPMWSSFFSGEGEDSANSVAVTESGNIVVAGAFAHHLTIGDDTLDGAGADNIFVAKLSPEGKRLWARAFGGNDIDAAHHVSAGPGDRIYVTGVFRDTARFGDHTLESEGNASIFALALDSDGEPIWVRGFGARGADYGRAIVPHPRGVALLAEFSLEVDFGAATHRSAGNRDLVVALLDPHGEPIWAERFGGYYNEVGVDLAVDPSGNVIATGSFDDEVDFGGHTLEAAGQSDAFVLKLDADGNTRWATRAGGEREDVGAGVAVDRYGNIVAVGWFGDEIDFGGPALESAGRRNGYVAKLSPDGEHIWSHRMGGDLGDMARAVDVADDGRVFVAGTFHRTAQFGDVELTAASEEAGSEIPYGDAFVALFTP